VLIGGGRLSTKNWTRPPNKRAPVWLEYFNYTRPARYRPVLVVCLEVATVCIVEVYLQAYQSADFSKRKVSR